jgi:Gpi18-like mannosyltransferase
MMIAERNLISGDTTGTQAAWWEYLSIHGWPGIATIKDDIGADYTPVWYFVICAFIKLGLYPAFPLHWNIKFIAICFTIVSAAATYLIVRHYSGRESWRPFVGALLILFIPAYFCDIVKTNLPDSSYLTFCLLAFLAFIKKRPCLAWTLVGIGMAFKMMALYLMPFLFFYYLKNLKGMKGMSGDSTLSRFAPLFAAVGFLLCSIPGVLAGQSYYDATVGSILGRASFLKAGGANFWAIFPTPDESWWPWFPAISNMQVKNMTIFGFAAIALILGLLYFMLFSIKKERLQEFGALLFLILSPLVCYFFMPAQHEGYFALASVASLIVCLINPGRVVFVVFSTLTALLWLGYHGFAHLPEGKAGAAYIISAIICLLVWQIWKLTPFSHRDVPAPAGDADE